jgi:hypothetical protein
MNAVVSTQASGLALPSDVLSALAEEARAAAATERPAVGRIGLKSGVMTYAGGPVAGNKMDAIILCASFRNVWYAGRYDPNNIVNPSCFALSMSDEGMVPHGNVTKRPADTCATCPNNEWGSDPNGGRGKACKQTRRLILLPGHAMDQGPEALATAELAVMDLPVTSVKNYSTYVNTLTASANVPTYAAVAEISVSLDAKTQFKVNFRAMRVVPSMEHLNAIKARMESARTLALEPYAQTSDPDEVEAAAAAAPARAPAGKRKY